MRAVGFNPREDLGEKLQQNQVEKIIVFWERALAWSHAQTKIPEHLMSRLSRLSRYLAELDERAKGLLAGVIPYVYVDYSSDAMIEQLSRLVDKSPQDVAELLEKMLRESPISTLMTSGGL
jgi:hypothetical protein